jgi:osmotically-inducible protein OsmY
MSVAPPTPVDREIEAAVEAERTAANRATLRRGAQLDSTAIDVVVAGDKVTLSGTVQAWAERRQADLAAWSSPHVTEVYNHVIVKAKVRAAAREA